MVPGTQVGGARQRRPRPESAGRSAERLPTTKRDPRLLDGLPQSVLGLQTMAGNAAVSRLISQRDQDDSEVAPTVQRDPTPDTNAPPSDEVAAAISEKFEILENQLAGAEEDDPAEAARVERTLLLFQFTMPADLASRDAVRIFLEACDKAAEKEDVTLAKLGKDATQAMTQYPQAFPNSWADVLAKTLDIGLDATGLAAERQRSWDLLTQVGARVPPEVAEWGLPVKLAELGSLKSFELKPEYATLDDAGVVRDFAVAALGYRGSAIRAEIVLWWKQILKNLVESVRAGDEVVDAAQLAKITGSQTKLADFARGGMAPGEDQFRELDAEVVNLGELQALTAIIAVGSGLHKSGQLWEDAALLFRAKLVAADEIVAAWGPVETLKHAFLWMIDHDYVTDALLLMAHVIEDNIGEIFAKLALFVGLQAVPFVDVIVDAYLAVDMGIDLFEALVSLGEAFLDATTAKNVIALQKSSGQLTNALLTAPLRIVLDYLGMSATLGQLEQRVAKLMAEDSRLTAEQAAKIAIREEKAGSTPLVDEPASTPKTEPDVKPAEVDSPAARTGGKDQPTRGKMRTGASEGLEATTETISEGTVKMEAHPHFSQTVAELEKRGIKFVTTAEDPHFVARRVINLDGKIVRTELELHAQPGMRWLDLEHEIGHVDQLTDVTRFPEGPPPSEIMLERKPGGPLVPAKNVTGVLKEWQNPIVEYHNRLVEVIRLADRNASPGVLAEHLDGVRLWAGEYRAKGLGGMKVGPSGSVGRKASQVAWAKEHFPDIGTLESKVYEVREKFEAAHPAMTTDTKATGDFRGNQ
jgi:hypothetical protein